MPNEHRRYIQHVPVPDEIRTAAEDFTPADRTLARKLCVWQCRLKAAREAQRAIAAARSPLYASLGPSTTPPPTAVAKAYGYGQAIDLTEREGV
jgi:hypothetical protein